MKSAKKPMSGESGKNATVSMPLSKAFGGKMALKGGERDDAPKMSPTKKKLMGKKIG